MSDDSLQATGQQQGPRSRLEPGTVEGALKAGRSRIPTWMLVAVPTVVAAITNLLWIGRQSFWQDEGFTARTITRAWPEFWDVVTNLEANMAGYYFVLRLWPFQDDEAGIRSLSALFIIAAVPLVFWIGRDLGGRPAGWWAALFFATWPFIVRYGQEARSYGLLIFFTLAATAALLKATRMDGRRWWVTYGLLFGLTPYLHVFAVLMVLPHAVWILVRRPPWGRVAVAASLALLVAAPMLVYIAAHGGAAGLAWIQRPTLGSFWRDVIEPMTWYSTAVRGALVLATVGLGVTSLVRRRDDLPTHAFLVTWACAPLLVALGFSVLVRPVLMAHYVITIIPAWTLLLGVAIARIRIKSVSAVTGVVVLVILARSLQGYYGGFVKPQIREAAALVASQARPGDTYVDGSGYQPALEYYWRNVGGPASGTGGTRLWVFAKGEATPPEGVATEWRLVWQQDLYHVSVALYEPASAAGG